jgi:hypothetical protein
MHEVEIVETPAHRVKVSVGYTRNMGNFESLRVDVGLELEGKGNPNPTFEKAYNWAEGKLLEKVDEVEKQLKDIKE